jgi:hypothetical protein
VVWYNIQSEQVNKREDDILGNESVTKKC